MPLFEYQCNDCTIKFEELVFNSSQKVVCPECKSENVTKELSTFSASVSGSTSLPCGNKGSGCGSGFS